MDSHGYALTTMDNSENFNAVNRKQQYWQFLKSDFWLKLSAEKRALNPACEWCGSVEALQAHHKFYRESWYNTELPDLETLCRRCHKKEHGVPTDRIMIFRDDLRFSRFMHWLHFLRSKMYSTLWNQVGLKESERWYLKQALKQYPPRKKDTCMQFHVEHTLKISEMNFK